jgi:hypothetical protein
MKYRVENGRRYHAYKEGSEFSFAIFMKYEAADTLEFEC